MKKIAGRVSAVQVLPRLPGALRIAGASVAAVLLAVAAGCSTTPSARPVLVSIPALAATAPATPAASSSAAPLLVVRRVTIPEYIESRRVRYRAEASTLQEWPNTYWAERIEIGVSREFAAALRSKLPGWSVCSANCGDTPPRATVQVDLAPLDFERGARRLAARARITVTLPSAGAASTSAPGSTTAVPAPRVREFSYQVAASADTPQAHAQAIAEALSQLAGDVVPMLGATP
ncbi:hypothetical protein BH09PSE5_BH09PSE5_24080 [soil metagenome]